MGTDRGDAFVGHDLLWVQALLRRMPGRVTVADLESRGGLSREDARAVFYACLANGWVDGAGRYTNDGAEFLRSFPTRTDPQAAAARVDNLLRRVESVNADEFWMHWVDAVACVEYPSTQGRPRAVAGDLAVYCTPRHPRYREHEHWTHRRAHHPGLGPDARGSLLEFLQDELHPVPLWCSADPVLRTAAVRIVYHRAGAAPVPVTQFGSATAPVHPDDRAGLQRVLGERRRLRP